MKKLIEKIESCGYDTEYDIPDLGLGFNQGLERAIAILKAEFEWKDIPDSEGVWKNDTGYIVLVTSGNGLWAKVFEDERWVKVETLTGKWCRVIMPESEG